MRTKNIILLLLICFSIRKVSGDDDQDPAAAENSVDKMEASEEAEPKENEEKPEEENEKDEKEDSQAQVPQRPKKPIAKHDFTQDPEYNLLRAVDFIKEEVSTHLMTDRQLNQAIRAVHTKEMVDMVATLKEHPKYQALDTLLIENDLGSLEYFDILRFTATLPKRSRIKPSFWRVSNHILTYLKGKGVLEGMRTSFEKTDFHRTLHKPIVKQKLQMLLNDVLNLKITHKIEARLRDLSLYVSNVLNCLLYIIGYINQYQITMSGPVALIKKMS